jgi:hypothetical protein
MGAGIAVGFRERYRTMYEEYRRRCKAPDAPWVFNLATPEDTWRSRATQEAIEAALRAMRTQADAEGARDRRATVSVNSAALPPAHCRRVRRVRARRHHRR